MSSITRSARTHVVGLDGLRALAAFAVVAHHVGFDTGTIFRGPLGIVWEQLDIGVAVFFVLSGFLLGGPFVRRLLEDRPIDGIGRFWWRRAVRIYPAYWVVLTVMVLFMGTTIRSVREGVMLYGLLQIYDADTFFAGMVQAWTLCVEISFYAVLPLLALFGAWLLRRFRVVRRERVLLWSCAALYVASTVWRLSMYLFPPSFGRLGMSWLPGQFDLFALGMGIAVLRAWADRDEGIGARLERWVRAPGLWFAGAGAVFAFMCIAKLRRPVVPVDSPFVFGDGREFARQLAFGAVAALLLAPLALRRPPLRGSARVLGLRPMVVLGVLSYGVYLWHKSLIPKVQSLLGLDLFGGGFVPVLLLVSIGATALAWVTYTLVEHPLLALVKGGPLRVRLSDRSDATTDDGQEPGQPPLGLS